MAAAINEITTRDENDKIHKQETLVARQKEEQLKFEKEQLELRAKYKEEPAKQFAYLKELVEPKVSNYREAQKGGTKHDSHGRGIIFPCPTKGKGKGKDNKAGSLKRLDSLVRKLKRDCLLDAYDAVIQEQIKDGVVESAEEPAVGREFYIPHKPIVKETSETTKLRVVYDASARGSATGPSLNDCLDIGPPLQNQIWKVLVCARFHRVVVAIETSGKHFYKCVSVVQTEMLSASTGLTRRTQAR
ncbi:hypothetical protein QZH41_016799 [Actinostola sp. cb2023]|nr:hypothetical protein QZH41_016799 [Actinostola sp. cb2023]